MRISSFIVRIPNVFFPCVFHPNVRVNSCVIFVVIVEWLVWTSKSYTKQKFDVRVFFHSRSDNKNTHKRLKTRIFFSRASLHGFNVRSTVSTSDVNLVAWLIRQFCGLSAQSSRSDKRRDADSERATEKKNEEKKNDELFDQLSSPRYLWKRKKCARQHHCAKALDRKYTLERTISVVSNFKVRIFNTPPRMCALCRSRAQFCSRSVVDTKIRADYHKVSFFLRLPHSVCSVYFIWKIFPIVVIHAHTIILESRARAFWLIQIGSSLNIHGFVVRLRNQFVFCLFVALSTVYRTSDWFVPCFTCRNQFKEIGFLGIRRTIDLLSSSFFFFSAGFDFVKLELVFLGNDRRHERENFLIFTIGITIYAVNIIQQYTSITVN